MSDFCKLLRLIVLGGLLSMLNGAVPANSADDLPRPGEAAPKEAAQGRPKASQPTEAMENEASLLAQLAGAPRADGLAPQATTKLDETVTALRAGNLTGVKLKFKRALQLSGMKSGAEIQTVTRSVLRAAFLDTADLRRQAESLRDLDEQRQQTQSHINMLRRVRVEADSGTKLGPDAVTPATTERERAPGYPVWKKQMLTDSGLEQYLAQLTAKDKKIREQRLAIMRKLQEADRPTRQRLASIAAAQDALQKAGAEYLNSLEK